MIEHFRWKRADWREMSYAFERSSILKIGNKQSRGSHK